MTSPWSDVVGVLLVAALGLIATLAGGPLVVRVFALVDRRLPPPAEPQPGVTDAAQVLRGGAWIGRLERLAIYAALMAGSPESMAMVLALKGLARYPELKATTSGAAERFIIGTFVSVLVAAACAGLAFWLLGLLR